MLQMCVSKSYIQATLVVSLGKFHLEGFNVGGVCLHQVHLEAEETGHAHCCWQHEHNIRDHLNRGGVNRRETQSIITINIRDTENDEGRTLPDLTSISRGGAKIWTHVRIRRVLCPLYKGDSIHHKCEGLRDNSIKEEEKKILVVIKANAVVNPRAYKTALRRVPADYAYNDGPSSVHTYQMSNHVMDITYLLHSVQWCARGGLKAQHFVQ